MAEVATESIRSCITCHKLESDLGEKLKNCAKCPNTLYCSRECQKADWKQHKRVCASKQASNKEAPTASPSPDFTAVDNILLGVPPEFRNIPGADSGLLALSEKECFTRLIDSFCMRVEDEYVYGGNIIGLYNGNNPLPDFKKFLHLAESRPNLLPPWWNKQKREECERLAVLEDYWSSINYICCRETRHTGALQESSGAGGPEDARREDLRNWCHVSGHEPAML
ncbi:unnamed protein product [Calypogeia fissa]